MKKLYLLTRKDIVKYDQYDAAVVCANSPKKAKETHPGNPKNYPTWTNLEFVDCHLVGIASKRTKTGVILASFNAG